MPGARIPIAELTGPAVARLEEMFRLKERKELLGEDEDANGFWSEFDEEDKRLIGRRAEVDRIVNTLVAAKEGVFWLHGSPGTGKSALMSAVAKSMRDRRNARENIAYRFRAGDPRATRAKFLRYAIDVLQQWKAIEATEVEMGESLSGLDQRLADLLAQVGGDLRVTFLLDGIDEILRSDPTIAELPFRHSHLGVVWLCAGRPEEPLRLAFREDRCVHLFPANGLEPLTDEEVGEWLKREAPSRERDQIVREETGEGKVAVWVQEVTRRSGGLPAYITMLLEDLAKGEIRVGDPVPKGLTAYFDDLLARCGVDDRSAALPLLLATIALAVDAPDPGTLEEVLRRAGRLSPSTREDHTAIVAGALARARSMLRTTPTSCGTEGFLPYHDAFTRHLASSPALRETRAAAAVGWRMLTLSPNTAQEAGVRRCAFEVGVRQLLALDCADDAYRLLQDRVYLGRRLADATPDAAGQAIQLLWQDYQAALRSAAQTAGFVAVEGMLQCAVWLVTGRDSPLGNANAREAILADEMTAWLVPPLVESGPWPPRLVRFLGTLACHRNTAPRRLAQQAAAWNPQCPGWLLRRIVRRATPVERQQVVTGLLHSHRSGRTAVVRQLAPRPAMAFFQRRLLSAAVELSAKTAINCDPVDPDPRELLSFWLDWMGPRKLRWLSNSRPVAWLVTRGVNAWLQRVHGSEERVPRCFDDLLTQMASNRPHIEPLLPYLSGPEGEGFSKQCEHCVHLSEQVFSIEVGLLHGLFLVQGVWHFEEAREVLRSVFERGGPESKMHVHSVLLRIMQNTPAEPPGLRKSVADEIFRVANSESEEDHFYETVGPQVGKSVYHPLAPAGAASAILRPGYRLSYFEEFISKAKAAPAADRKRRLERAARDLLWVGVYYPRETFATLPLLVGLEESRENLLDTVAQLSVAQAPETERFYAQYLKGIVAWSDLKARIDYPWINRYIVERGLGQTSGTLLLRHGPFRMEMVAGIRDLLGTTHLTIALVRKILGRACGLMGVS